MIDLPDENPAIVKLLVQYLYEGEYTVPRATTPPHPTNSDPEAHVCVEHYRRGQKGDLDICYHGRFFNTCSTPCHSRFCVLPEAPAPNEPDDDHNPLLIHAKVYVAAIKYDVAGLEAVVEQEFMQACDDRYDRPSFAVAARYVFENTPENDRGLREIVTKTVVKHGHDLLKKPDIFALVTQFSSLATAIIRMKATQGWN